ncbi:hypothetical protein N431DRAFT_548361 [Stipitochalara longipes BDJ]|nr:hypothetical protein N431DRAFT_548361 [Stipitochalara longipes BDJ]
MDSPEFTTFAKVYTHPSGGGHRAIAGFVPYKSGLTPIPVPSPPNTNPTSDELLQIRAWEKYQVTQLKGFTAADLDLLETLAITNGSTDDTILNNTPIHQAFAKPRWMVPLPKHLAQYPLGLDRPGYWHVENNFVWDALQPSLRLASQTLENAHSWPWFEAFIDPRCYERIPNSELPLPHQNRYYERFKLRPPHIAAQDGALMRQKIILLSTRIQFNLASGLFEKKNNDFDLLDGSTDSFSAWQGTTCNLSYQLIAFALLHEFTHALWDQMQPLEHPQVQDYHEPYFEDEAMAEVGFSMEVGVFGGTNTPFKAPKRRLPRSLPPAGVFSSSPFSWMWRSAGATNQPYFNLDKPAWNENAYFPIPISYFVTLFHPRFWQTYVKKYGYKSIHMGPKTLGTKYFRGGLTNEAVAEDDYISHPDGAMEDLEISDDMDEDERISSMLENVRRQVSRRVLRACYDKSESRQAIEKLALGSPHHGYVNDQDSDDDSEDSNESSEDSDDSMIVAPQTYRYRQFDPGCSVEQYASTRDFLFANRQQLALDSLYFDIEEHIMLAYINRLGVQMYPSWWRGFLLYCILTGELFGHREIGASPTSTTLTITRIDSGWPTDRLPPRNLWSQVPSGYMKGPYPILRVFDYGTRKMLRR